MKIPRNRNWIVSGLFAVVVVLGGCTREEKNYVPQAATTAGADKQATSTTESPAGASASSKSILEQVVKETRSKSSGTKTIRWLTSLKAARQEAKRTGKPIMVDLYAEWCGPCQMLEEQTYSHPKIIEESKKWLAVKLNVDEEQATIKELGLEGTGIPLVLFLKSNGHPVKGFIGFRGPQEVLAIMRQAHRLTAQA